MRSILTMMLLATIVVAGCKTFDLTDAAGNPVLNDEGKPLTVTTFGWPKQAEGGKFVTAAPAEAASDATTAEPAAEPETPAPAEDEVTADATTPEGETAPATAPAAFTEPAVRLVGPRNYFPAATGELRLVVTGNRVTTNIPAEFAYCWREPANGQNGRNVRVTRTGESEWTFEIPEGLDRFNLRRENLWFSTGEPGLAQRLQTEGSDLIPSFDWDGDRQLGYVGHCFARVASK